MKEREFIYRGYKINIDASGYLSVYCEHMGCWYEYPYPFKTMDDVFKQIDDELYKGEL